MIATTLNPAIIKLRHPQYPFKPTKLRHPFAAFNCKAEHSKERKNRGTGRRGDTVEGNPESGNGNGRRPPFRKGKGKRGAYGTSRRSILKKSFSQEQIVFTSPIADDPVVAIIGGGISGKCANRLLSLSGLPLIAGQMKRLELSSIWALLAAFEEPLSLQSHSSIPFEGAFVRGVEALSWMANNTKKLFPLQSHGPECWTFFSSAAYGKRNKVPQENIPNVTADKVKKEMLQDVEISLGLPTGSLPQPIYTRLQLWGAALPTNTPGLPCIFDPHGRAGICGDWLLGSSVEAASLSGMALGNHIADFIQSGGAQPEDFAVGLHDEFRPIKGHDIGQFPGLDTTEVSAVLSM